MTIGRVGRRRLNKNTEEAHWKTWQHVEAMNGRYVGQNRHVHVPGYISKTFT